MDIIPKLSRRGLTTATAFPYFLLLVDIIYSRRPFLRGITNNSTASGIDVVHEFQAPTSHPYAIVHI
jgi:hypothetical protein